MRATTPAAGTGQLRRWYEAALLGILPAASGLGVVRVVLGPAVVGALHVLSPAQLSVVGGGALAGAVLVATATLGPLWVTAAEDRWRPTGELLDRRRRTVLAGGVVVALCLGTSAAVAGPAASAMQALVGASLVTVLAGAVAVVGQQLDAAARVRAGGVLLMALSMLVAAQLSRTGPLPMPTATLAAVAVAVRNVVPIGLATSSRWRPVPPRWELRRAGAAVESALMAAVMLDVTPLSAFDDAQAAPRRRPLRLPVALRPLARLLGDPRLAELLPLMALPAVAERIAGHAAAATSLLLVAYLVSLPAGRALDSLVDSPVLRRAYAVHRPPLELVLGGTAVTVTGLLTYLAAALAGLGRAWAAVAVLLAVLGWARRRTGRQLAGRVGALIATPMGLVPLDLAQRVLAGPDVLLLGALVLPGRTAGVALLVVAAACGAHLAGTRRGRSDRDEA